MIDPDIFDAVFEEAQLRYDREIPTWVEYKRAGADIIRWARLEILSRSAERCRSSGAIPHGPGKVPQTPLPQAPGQHPAVPSTVDSTELPDSGLFPNWLEPSRESSQASVSAWRKREHPGPKG
jgi:hypothetical protein